MVLYSIYDVVADDYGPVLTCKNDAVARRAYWLALESMKGTSADDFHLYRLGEFVDGRIQSHTIDPVRVSVTEVAE